MVTNITLGVSVLDACWSATKFRDFAVEYFTSFVFIISVAANNSSHKCAYLHLFEVFCRNFSHQVGLGNPSLKKSSEFQVNGRPDQEK